MPSEKLPLGSRPGTNRPSYGQNQGYPDRLSLANSPLRGLAAGLGRGLGGMQADGPGAWLVGDKRSPKRFTPRSTGIMPLAVLLNQPASTDGPDRSAS